MWILILILGVLAATAIVVVRLMSSSRPDDAETADPWAQPATNDPSNSSPLPPVDPPGDTH